MTDQAQLEERVDALTRNDPDTCETIARDYVYTVGAVPAHVLHYMFKLQDDDTELRRRLAGIEAKVVDVEVR